MPAISREARGGVVHKPRANLAVNGNAVVIVDGHQLIQPPRPGQSAGFVADAFHQAAIAQKHPGAVIHHRVPGAVELGGQQFFGQRHAHRVGEALTQRAGGGLDTRRDINLGVAGCQTVELAKALELGHGQAVATEVQQSVQQHGAVPVGQHKAVAVGPLRLLGVMAQVLLPQHGGNFCHPHRRARVPRIGLLDGVHGQGPNGVGQSRMKSGAGSHTVSSCIANENFKFIAPTHRA